MVYFGSFSKDLHNVSFLFISVLDYPCNLLQVDKEFLATKLTSRVMKTTWGGKTEEVVVTNNIQQAESTRDALAKGIYSRIFDFLVEVCTLHCIGIKILEVQNLFILNTSPFCLLIKQ